MQAKESSFRQVDAYVSSILWDLRYWGWVNLYILYAMTHEENIFIWILDRL